MIDEREIIKTVKGKLKEYTYYIVIGVAALISCCLLPFLGSTIGMEIVLPQSTLEWILWVGMRVIIAVLNVLIFFCFLSQAKLNVKKDPKFIEANEILCRTQRKDYHPRSPKKWKSQQYGKKTALIVLTSLLSIIVLSEAILRFETVIFISYLITVGLGIIFGVFAMRSAEDYWTNEYYEYALYIKSKKDPQEPPTSQETSPVGTLDVFVVDSIKTLNVPESGSFDTINENIGDDNENNTSTPTDS